MKIETSSKQYSTAGSYIDLLFAAVVMQILFFITAMWSGSSNYDFYSDNQEHIRFALRIQLGLGWVMCIIAGLGFSILPLIYDLHSFGKSVMRTYVGLNMSGQVAIMIGVVSGILMDDLLIFETLATIGITLLCASLVTLGPSAIAIFKIRSPKENKTGPFTYSIGALMPFLGAITLACWVLRERVERILNLSESIIFDFFIVITVVALLISHFNRRLDWKIINQENLGKVFGIFTIMLLLSVIGEPLYYRDEISIRVFAVLVSAPFLFIFLMLNPKRILKCVFDKKPFNKMLLAAVFWLPVVGFVSFVETMGYVHLNEGGLPYSRLILIFGVVFQSLWGFAEYLHDDHKRLSIHRRKTKWIVLISVNLGLLIVLQTFALKWLNGNSMEGFPRPMVFCFAISFVVMLFHWIKDIFFSFEDWHKTPMFYDQYLDHPDEGSGFSPED